MSDFATTSPYPPRRRPPPPPSMTNNNRPSSSTSSSSWSTIPIRLLSSVAVVGRDNEPIYLRGDLCHVPAVPASSDLTHTIEDNDDDHDDDDDGIVDDADHLHHTAADASSSSSSPQKRGLLGRMRGVLSPNEATTKTDHEKEDATSEPQNDNFDDDDDDPFGFFTDQPNNAPSSSMSLTQQLVLHASLDRLEEMTIQSGSQGGKWRMPGSSGPNAMWMGLLCEVEERWSVYGYLTNTGIKFMIIVENVQVDEEGIRQKEYASSLLSNSSSFVDPIPTKLSSSSSSRESDLKQIFSHLHELYVRYTLNPFTKLRSPIQSHAFDRGIMDMAQSFNEKAWKCVCEERGVECGSSSSLLLEGSLSWM